MASTSEAPAKAEGAEPGAGQASEAENRPHLTVEEIRRQAQERLREIEPLVSEVHELRQMLGLEPRDEQSSSSSLSTAPRPAPAARRSSNGRGRPKGSGQRADQTLALLRERGPMKVAEVAQELGINPNYMYRILPGLVEADQAVKLEDNRYAAKEA